MGNTVHGLKRRESVNHHVNKIQWRMRRTKMLTKKDFKAVAEIIEQACGIYDDEEVCGEIASIITHNLADYFATQNPRFDRERFMKACGLE